MSRREIWIPNRVPTSSDYFDGLPERFGHSVLLVTHSETAAAAADYVWLMRDGRLVNCVRQRA